MVVSILERQFLASLYVPIRWPAGNLAGNRCRFLAAVKRIVAGICGRSGRSP